MRDFKADFPIFAQDKTVYIDNAATAQRPACVLDAERNFYLTHNANPLRGLYALSVAATEDVEAAREAVRAFIGARHAEEIIFTRNTTESLNLVAYSYGRSQIHAGDEVLVSITEHHSDLLPWQAVCRETGAALRYIECEPDGSIDLDKVEKLITDKTKLVAVTQVSNVLGRVNPIREIADMAHRVGAVLVCDGAQSTPHMRVDVQALDADFRSVIANAKRHTLIFADRFPVRYFVEEYGLDYFAAFPGCADDAEPSARTVAFLIDRVREEQAPAVLYIEFSNQKMADIVCEDTGCKKLLFNSCHNVTADQLRGGVTYLELMRGNLETVKEALG